MDKSAVGYEHQEKLQLHESQKGKKNTTLITKMLKCTLHFTQKGKNVHFIIHKKVKQFRTSDLIWIQTI